MGKKRENAATKAGRLLGKRGGSKGGRTAAENMTAEERTKRARHAANVRWGKA